MASMCSSQSAAPKTCKTNCMTLLAIVAILAVSVSLACDDAANEDNEVAQEDDKTTSVDLNDTLADTDITAGSRAVGGIPVKPFPWLMNFWGARGYRPVMDGKFIGHAIRLTNHTFLAHDVSCLLLERDPYDSSDKLPMEFSIPERIDVTAGPPRQTNSVGCAYKYTPGIKRTFGPGFSVFDFKKYSHDPIEAILRIYNLKEGPRLQDANHMVTTDCYLYAYSANSDANGAPKSSIRTFSKFPLKFKKYHAVIDYVDFEIQSGRACLVMSDVGAPILCGGKLSYVLGRQDHQLGVTTCTNVVSALMIIAEDYRR